MKFFAVTFALLIGLVTPVRAQMTQQLCDQGWQRIASLIDLPKSAQTVDQDVSFDGWCRVKGGSGGTKVSDFKELRWKSQGLEEALEKDVPPQMLMVEFDDVDFAKSFYLTTTPGLSSVYGDIRVSLFNDVDNRGLSLEHLLIDLGALGDISLTGKAGGVDFSSASAMQYSIGAIRIHSARLVVNAKGLVPRLIMPSVMANQPEDQSQLATLALFSQQINALLKDVPPTFLAPNDETAIRAVLRSLPRAKGRLELHLQSEPGLGVMQLVLGVNAIEKAKTEGKTLAPALAQLFHAMKLNVTWAPNL